MGQNVVRLVAGGVEVTSVKELHECRRLKVVKEENVALTSKGSSQGQG